MLDAQLRAIWRTNAFIFGAELIVAGVLRLILGHHLDAAVAIVSGVVVVTASADLCFCLNGMRSVSWLTATATAFATAALFFWIAAAFIPALVVVAVAGWMFALFLAGCAAKAAQEEGGVRHSLAYFVTALPAIGNGFAVCIYAYDLAAHLCTRRAHMELAAPVA